MKSKSIMSVLFSFMKFAIPSMMIVLGASVGLTLPSRAETEQVGDYTWTYRINGDTAEIYNADGVAVTPNPNGIVSIPALLGGKHVTSVRTLGFIACTGLTSVTMPNSVTNIGYSAFSGCRGLESITIPDGVKTIGASAFSGCWSLKSVTIPDGVKSIGVSAFSDCHSLTSITIPNSVTNIGSSAFSGCYGVKDVIVSQCVLDRRLYEVFSYACSSITNISYVSTITNIGSSAFSGCTGLTSIAIPNSVTSIGSSAFSGCDGLTSVTIPDSVTSIGSSAFSGCTGLTSIAIPNSVTSIGSSMFSGCTGLTSVTIPNSVTSIGSSAFSGCTGLTSVTIPDSVTSIGYRAFNNCSGLSSMTIPDSVTSIEDGAFYDCSGLMSFTVASGNANYMSTNGFLLTKDGETLIRGVNGNAVIPNGVAIIAHSAFNNCSGLSSVTIPDSVTDIGSSAFSGCTGLTSVAIPNSVTNIGPAAFNNCSGLSSVTIPDSVTDIGSSAFSGCTGLTGVAIPNSVTNIGPAAFAGCRNVCEATVPGWKCGIPFSNVTNLVISPETMCIRNNEFTSLTGLKSVTMPNSIMSIGDWAFSDCDGLVDVTIPNSVTNIGNGAFSGCSSLTSVTIPESVTTIGYSAFNHCSRLTSVYIMDVSAWCNIKFITSDGTFSYSGENPLVYANDLYVNGELVRDLVIPDEVSYIGDNAFCGYDGLRSVTIPSSVTNIGAHAFASCTGLTSITIPNSVTDIGVYAFAGCSGLANIAIPNSIASIGHGAFSRCTSISSITIPDGVVSVKDWAFFDCTNLVEIAIPTSVTSISSTAFDYCNGLQNIFVADGNKMYSSTNGWLLSKDGKTLVRGLDGGRVIPDSVTHIGYYAFSGCSNMTKVTLPPDATYIGYGAFRDCSALTDIVLPDNLEYIEAFAFEGCSGLTCVIIPPSVSWISSYAFERCSCLSTIEIPWEYVRGIAYSAMPHIQNGAIPKSVRIVKYEPVQCVSLNAMDGMVSPESITVQYRKTYSSVPMPNREGYSFCGWKLSDGGIVDKDTTVRSISSHTLYAQWNVNRYSVIFDANGGVGSVTNEQDYDSEIVVPEVMREGYTFTGWQPALLETVPASNVTYTAQWRINQYEVVFDGNGGALGESSLSSVTNTQDYGSAIVAPDVVREGYTFAGWQPEVDTTVPASNVTYIAQWRINQYEVAFDGNDGVLGESALPRVVTSQDYGSAIVPPSASRVGCTFDGWVPVVDATVPARNVAYTAQWKVWDITVGSADVKIKDLYPDDYGRITNIVIGVEIEILPSGFFDGCDSLESITFRSPETDIGDNDLRKVGRLFEVQPDGYWIVQGVLLGYKGDCPSAIPSVDSIKRVIGDALEGCIALTDLTFTAESVLTSIGTNAFKGCTELRALTLPPSLEDIGDEAFMGCSYLDNVIVPGSVKRVGARAFKNCTGFTGALIEYGVESLGDEAFYGDWRISEVDIPSSVTNIGVSAFGGDSSIIRVGLRGDVRKVSEIFSNYAILREATVKEGDGAIVDGLFEGCAELADVHFLGNSPELANDGRNIYGGTPETLTTYVATTSTGWDGTKGSHSLPQAWPLAGIRRSIAQWDLPTYLVLFDSNGGTLDVQSTYQYSERKFTLPPEPVQTGYKFAGWWTKPVGGLRVTGDTVFIEGVYRTLYAHWTKGRWVFLDPNGGTVENEFVTYIEQTEYGVLPTPVRTGYAFDGWTYNGKTVLATDELLTDEDHVLKADWRKNKYTVTFDANFGDGGGVYELEYDSAIVPPVVVREGYTFVGWSPEVAATVPASNVTYAAQWKLNEYRVSLFVGNGEEGSQLVVTHGAKVGDIALPTRDGYVFGGWYDKPEDGKLVDGDTLIVGDMSLYAKWNSIYTVVFDANGGEGVMPDQPFVYGEEQSLSNIVFKATDRRFAGWATEKDGIVEYDDGEVVSNLTEIANGVVTLFAAWEVWTDDMQVCDDVFGGDGVVSLDENDNIIVTLTNDVSGTVEMPDNVGAVTIDLNGHNMVGDGGLGEPALPGGPAIRVVKGDGEGGATRLAIVDTSEGEKGQVVGGGESAGIEIAEDAAKGVKLDVEEGVGVFNGDGSEQELKTKLVGTGKVTVPKTWKVGRKVTWKATADKGSVFARWEGPLVDSLNLTKNERRNPSLAFAVPKGFETNMVTAVFIPIDDDGLYSLGITQTEFELKEAVSDVWVTDDSQSYVTATASGLPAGLKFDAKKMCITGAPTKGGVYWVQIKAKNASGYQWAENVKVTVSGDGKEAKEPKLTRTAYYPLTVICATEGGTVSGTGVYAEGKKVSVKATPAKGYVFAGWHETANSEKGTVNGVDGADYRSASLKVTVPETRYVFALFATKEDDADSLKVAVEDVTTEKDGTIALNLCACVESLSLPKLAVSGLPSGVKYDAKTLKIVGKATKPGVYTVTVKATNAAVAKATDASTTTFKITVPNFECAALPGLKPETDAYGIVRSGVIFDDGLVDCTPANGWTVKVAGLPSGLKWDAKIGKIVGVPTAKAGAYTVTFTASKKGEANQIATITLNVEALPDWVVGTFYGKNVARGLRGTWTCPQQFTVTISANGKISMKTVSPGEGAESRTAQLTECREDGSFAFSFYYASGRKGKDGYSEGDCAGIISPVAYGEDGALLGCLTTQDIGVCDEDDDPFESKGVVYQSLYSRKPAVSGLPVFGKDNIRVVPVKSDYSDGEVTLKFGTKGAVTAAWSGTKPIATCSSYISPYARDADGTVHAKLWLTFLDKTRIDGYGDFVQIGFEFDLLILASDKVSASDVDVVSARLTSIIADVLNGDDVELVQQ